MRRKADEYWRRQDKLNFKNPLKSNIFAKKSLNVPRRPRIWLNFISVKLPRPPRSGSRNRAWTHSKMIFFKSHRTIRFRTLKLHTHAIHCIDRYNFKLKICIKMHEISWNYIDRHNFKLDICIKIWKTASLDTISKLKMTCFRTKTEVLESWNFVGKSDLQNALKKRLGSCSIPGSTRPFAFCVNGRAPSVRTTEAPDFGPAGVV